MVTEWSRPNTRSYECRAAHLGRSNHGEEFGSIMPTDRDWVLDVVTGYNTDIDTCTITKGSTNKISAGQSLELHRAQKARAQSAERRGHTRHCNDNLLLARPEGEARPALRGQYARQRDRTESVRAKRQRKYAQHVPCLGARGYSTRTTRSQDDRRHRRCDNNQRATAVDISCHKSSGTRRSKVSPCRTTCSHVSMTKCLDRRRALLVNAEGAAKAEQHAYQR